MNLNYTFEKSVKKDKQSLDQFIQSNQSKSMGTKNECKREVDLKVEIEPRIFEVDSFKVGEE